MWGKLIRWDQAVINIEHLPRGCRNAISLPGTKRQNKMPDYSCSVFGLTMGEGSEDLGLIGQAPIKLAKQTVCSRQRRSVQLGNGGDGLPIQHAVDENS